MMLCGGPAMHLFSSTELERLVCGNPILDFKALEANARYDGGYNAEHRVTVWPKKKSKAVYCALQPCEEICNIDRSCMNAVKASAIVPSAPGSNSSGIRVVVQIHEYHSMITLKVAVGPDIPTSPDVMLSCRQSSVAAQY